MKCIFAGLGKHVRVGPYDLEIAITKLGDNIWGSFTFAKQVIELAPEQPSGIFALDTFLHELNHAIFVVYDLKDSDNEERIASVLATGWTQVYRDNPRVLDWIRSITNACAKQRMG